LSAPSPRACNDWTFSYKLSKPVYCKESVADKTIKFEKDTSDNLIGFQIIVENKTDSESDKINKMKTENLEKILTILSGIELKAIPAGAEGVPKKPGLRRVTNQLIVKYDREGSIDKVDITDSNIGNIINKDVNPELGYLSDAVAHKTHGRYSEAIKEAFRVIDEKKAAKNYSKSVKYYYKYKCMRDILSHREGQRLFPNTKKSFARFFSPVRDKFDFKYCDENKGEFIFDLDSSKTKRTLEQVAKDLIEVVKSILGL
jgi:hypothetical protein